MATIMNNMIDIHNHSLPGVDDGAKNMEEAIANIRYLKSKGFSSFVLTSHYIVNTKYSSSVEDRKGILEELKKSLEDKDIKLYLGNEVYVNKGEVLIDLLKRGEIRTPKGSKYLLIELPLDHRLRHLENIICDLNAAGLVPIIAHPERYTYIQEDFEKIYDLLEFDCRLQCNLTSIIGRYGSNAKKTMKRLIKEKLVSFVATDFHHYHDDSIGKALKKLSKYMSEGEMNTVLQVNPQIMLDNGNIPVPFVKHRKYK